jgi:hypothetical protein
MSSLIKELTAAVKQLTIANVIVLALIALIVGPAWVIHFMFTTGRMDAFLPDEVEVYSTCQVYSVYVRGANRNIITRVLGEKDGVEHSLGVNRTDREFTVPEIYALCTDLNEKADDLRRADASSSSSLRR